MKRILIVAAHPDDEVLGCGGLMARLVPRGVAFQVLFVGEGSTCRFDDPADPRAADAIANRRLGAERAMQLLGVTDYHFHDLPCGRFDQVPIIRINKLIETAIRSFQPDTVLTHSGHDANNDHRLVFDATIMATRPGAQNHVERLLSFEVLSSSEWAFDNSFSPNHFVRLDEADLQRKWQALALYDTEVRPFPFPRSHDGLRTLAMMRGMQAGFPLAEAYHLVREFVQ